MKQQVEKTSRETFKDMSRCNRAGIRIYPIPWGSRFKIEIERNGKPKRGEEIYPEKSEKGMPGVYDKIQELYRQISENMEKKQTSKAA